MSTDRPSRDRPSHEEFLAELAALDEVLRTPAEPARPPVTVPDTNFAERRDLVAPVPPPPSPPPPLPPPPRHDAGSRKLRASGAAVLSVGKGLPRRSFVHAPLVLALSGGLLAGGYLGWWLTTSPTSPLVNIEPEPAAAPASPALPASSASPTKAPDAASRAARPAAAPRAKSRTDVSRPAASKAAPRIAVPKTAVPKAVEPSAVEPNAATVAPPPVSPPSALASRSGIPSAASAPVPLIEAPVRGTPPLLPDSPAAVAAKARAAVAADQAAIEATLRQYEQAYERLDAKAAVAVWPTVDQRALSRAFAGLASQALNFRGCDVVVRAGASTATASCSGTAEYVRKVGDTRVRVEPREWTFTLNKTEGEWRIDAVDGRVDRH